MLNLEYLPVLQKHCDINNCIALDDVVLDLERREAFRIFKNMEMAQLGQVKIGRRHQPTRIVLNKDGSDWLFKTATDTEIMQPEKTLPELIEEIKQRFEVTEVLLKY